MARGYGSFSIAVSNMERKRRRQNKRAEEIKAIQEMQRNQYREDKINGYENKINSYNNGNDDVIIYCFIIFILVVFGIILIYCPWLIAIGMIIGFFIALFH